MPSRLLGGNALDLFRTAICAQQHSRALCALRNRSLEGRATPAGKKDNARRDNPARSPCARRGSLSHAQRKIRHLWQSVQTPDRKGGGSLRRRIQINCRTRRRSRSPIPVATGRKLAHPSAGKGDVGREQRTASVLQLRSAWSPSGDVRRALFRLRGASTRISAATTRRCMS